MAFGPRNTLVADFLGDEIGLAHGIANTRTVTLSNMSFPTGPNGDATGAAVPVRGNVTGSVSAGSAILSQYSGAFGYKVKVAANVVAYFNALVRFDSNGLTAKVAPMFGLSYTFVP